MELTKQITFFMGLFAGGVGTALWFLVANSYHGKNDEETKPKQTNSTENNNKKALESTEQITARNDESICSDLSSTKNTNDQEEKATQTTRNKRTRLNESEVEGKSPENDGTLVAAHQSDKNVFYFGEFTEPVPFTFKTPDKQESFLITSATSNVTTSKLSGGRRRISVRRQCNFADNLKDNTLIGNKASNNEQTRSQVAPIFGSSTRSSTSPKSTDNLFGETNASIFKSSFGPDIPSYAPPFINGTSLAKFSPLEKNDTIYKYGQRSEVITKIFSITAMKEYEEKSLDELRLEDYNLNLNKSLNDRQSVAQVTSSLESFLPTGTNASESSNSLFISKAPLFGSPATNTTAFGFGQLAQNQQ